jgi:hypothetical protein
MKSISVTHMCVFVKELTSDPLDDDVEVVFVYLIDVSLSST